MACIYRLGRFIFIVCLIAYGFVLITNEEMATAFNGNLTRLLKMYPQLDFCPWILAHSTQILKGLGLLNIFSVAMIYSSQVCFLTLMNVLSVVLSFGVLYNPMVADGAQAQQHAVIMCLKGAALIGGLGYIGKNNAEDEKDGFGCCFTSCCGSGC